MNKAQPTIEQIKIIKQDWLSLRNIRPDMMGDVFFGKLFLDYPKLQGPVKKISKEFGAADLNVALTETISIILSRIDRPESLRILMQNLIKDLPEMHQPLFEKLATCWLWTLKRAFGNQWTADSERAWGACINRVAACIFD
ncbi:globin domain-containing protein [Dyadobacter crusticola]|uniref:globin domain-containing protein n=1 Tax=Dyadobacter crusticola TaxID=292407 RepID=UPI0004E26168|nr:globin domain-containing protein [Dyadobacter crusticola]